MLLKMKPSQVDKSDNPPVIAEQYILILGHLYLCPFIVLLLTHMTCDVTNSRTIYTCPWSTIAVSIHCTCIITYAYDM